MISSRQLRMLQINETHSAADVSAISPRYSDRSGVDAASKGAVEQSKPARQKLDRTGAIQPCWDAHLDWAQVHVKPHLAHLAFCAAITAFCLSTLVVYGVGISWPTPILQIPAVVSVMCMLCLAAMLVRSGPVHASQSVRRALWGIFAPCVAMYTIASFVGPRRLVPFDSQVVNVCCTALVTFSASSCGVLGGNSADLPQQPYSSLLPPLCNAASTALCFTDTLTDFGFVRLLLQQVSHTVVAALQLHRPAQHCCRC